MASVTLTIPNPIANRFLDSFCLRKGYTGFLADGITPQTKTEFYKADIIRYSKNVVSEQESITAANIACQLAQQDVENNIEIS